MCKKSEKRKTGINSLFRCGMTKINKVQKFNMPRNVLAIKFHVMQRIGPEASEAAGHDLGHRLR